MLKSATLFLCTYLTHDFWHSNNGVFRKADNKNEEEFLHFTIMKNLFLILFLILGIGITYAGKNYKVTVTYEIIYEYYDDSNGSYMGEKPAGTSSNKFSFYAETPHEAEEKAISQCSSTYSSSGTYQGPGEYKGKKCKVYQKRRVISARAQ